MSAAGTEALRHISSIASAAQCWHAYSERMRSRIRVLPVLKRAFQKASANRSKHMKKQYQAVLLQQLIG
jgi:hypothetical protein